LSIADRLFQKKYPVCPGTARHEMLRTLKHEVPSQVRKYEQIHRCVCALKKFKTSCQAGALAE
jgi:hypothetical protein